MKEKYEYDIIKIRESYQEWQLDSKKKEGWEVYKTEVIKEKDEVLFRKSETTIKVYHIRRNITPIKIKVNTTIEVPKWAYDKKEVGGFIILGQMNSYFNKKGLLDIEKD